MSNRLSRYVDGQLLRTKQSAEVQNISENLIPRYAQPTLLRQIFIKWSQIRECKLCGKILFEDTESRGAAIVHKCFTSVEKKNHGWPRKKAAILDWMLQFSSFQ